jgi:hypothetical protein
MPSVVTSVHNRVTCSTTTTPMSYRKYRFHYMVDETKATDRFYDHVDNECFKQYGHQYNICCSSAWFVRDSSDGLIKVISHKCKLRWCPVCSKSRAYRISQSLLSKLNVNTELRLLTLTLKHNETSLISSSDRIYKCFQRLRKTSKFKKFVKGGVWFYQLVWSKKTLSWHPHIHCVIAGKYFKQSEIKALWQKITGDSYVVDIRFAQKKSKVISYVSRYVSRPVSLVDCPAFEYVNLYKAFKSRKLCGSWGKLRGVDLRGTKEPVARQLVRVGSWSTVFAMEHYDGNAMLIIDYWKKQIPINPGVSCMVYDNLIDDMKPVSPRASPDPWLL